MMRSLRLLPTRRPVSNTCRSAGALMAIHPETLPPCGLVIGTTSDAVAPGSISTSSLKLPESFSSTTRWVPAVSPLTVTGVRPYALPSTLTVAFDGSVRTCKSPMPAAALGSSMKWDTWAPAVMVTGTWRRSAPLTSSTTCAPGVSVTVSGVMPRSVPSMNTGTLSGFVPISSVPLAAAEPQPCSSGGPSW